MVKYEENASVMVGGIMALIESIFSFLNKVLTPVVALLSKLGIYLGTVGMVIGLVLLSFRLFFKKGVTYKIIFAILFASCGMFIEGKIFQGSLEKENAIVANEAPKDKQEQLRSLEKDELNEQSTIQDKPMVTDSTSTAVEQQEQEAAQQQEAEEQETDEKVIPGITAADIKLNFTDKGFEFTGPRPMQEFEGYFDDGEAIDPATGIEYSITIDALSPSQVRVVQYRADGAHLAGLIDHNTFLKVAKEFLGFCATLPYEGSKPEKARKWVEENIQNVKQGSPAKTVIGPVEIMLAGGDYFRYIQLKPVE